MKTNGPHVSVFMDVEDPISPLADDAVLDLAALFTDQGVRGSFCTTGEKCRVLKRRGRQDVIRALEPHCLGLHTDTHSFHPTTMELLAELSYLDGCEAVYEAERHGFDAFCESFHRAPVYWGGAGNTWSPEIADALKRLGIPAYSYALTGVPGGGVHRFDGVVALPQTFAISEEAWCDDVQAADESERVLQAIEAGDLPWIGVFVGHPTRFRHRRFWDEPFAAGKTPTHPQPAPTQDPNVYESAKSNLRRFLARLQRSTVIVGVDEALDLPWKFGSATSEERAFFEHYAAEQIRAVSRWPIHRPDLDVANIVAKTIALSRTLETATLL